MFKTSFNFVCFTLLLAIFLSACGKQTSTEPSSNDNYSYDENNLTNNPQYDSPIDFASYPPRVIDVMLISKTEIQFRFSRNIDTSKLNDANFTLSLLVNDTSPLADDIIQESFSPINLTPSPLGMYLILLFDDLINLDSKYKFSFDNLYTYGCDIPHSGNFYFYTNIELRGADSYSPPIHPPEGCGCPNEMDTCFVTINGEDLAESVIIVPPDLSEPPNGPTWQELLEPDSPYCEITGEKCQVFCNVLTPNIDMYEPQEIAIKPTKLPYKTPEWHLNVIFKIPTMPNDHRSIFGLEAAVYYLAPGVTPDKSDIIGGGPGFKEFGKIFARGYIMTCEIWCTNSFIATTYVLPQHQDKFAGLVPWLIWFAGCEEETGVYGPVHFDFKELYTSDLCPAYIDYVSPHPEGYQTKILDLVVLNTTPRPNSNDYEHICTDITMQYQDSPILAYSTEFGTNYPELDIYEAGLPKNGKVGDIALRDRFGETDIIVLALVKGFQPKHIKLEMTSSDNLLTKDLDLPEPYRNPTTLYLYHTKNESEVIGRFHRFFNGSDPPNDCYRNLQYASDDDNPWDGPYGIYVSKKDNAIFDFHRTWIEIECNGKPYLWAWPQTNEGGYDCAYFEKRHQWHDVGIAIHSVSVCDIDIPVSRLEPLDHETTPIINVSHRNGYGMEPDEGLLQHDIAIITASDIVDQGDMDCFRPGPNNKNDILDINIRGIGSFNPIASPFEPEYRNPEYFLKVAGYEEVFLTLPEFIDPLTTSVCSSTSFLVQSHPDVLVANAHGRGDYAELLTLLRDKVYDLYPCNSYTQKIHPRGNYNDFILNDCNVFNNFWMSIGTPPHIKYSFDTDFLWLFACSQMKYKSGDPDGKNLQRQDWHTITSGQGGYGTFMSAVGGYNEVATGSDTLWYWDYEGDKPDSHLRVSMDAFSDQLTRFYNLPPVDQAAFMEFYNDNIYIFAFMEAHCAVQNAIDGREGKEYLANPPSVRNNCIISRAMDDNDMWYIYPKEGVLLYMHEDFQKAMTQEFIVKKTNWDNFEI